MSGDWNKRIRLGEFMTEHLADGWNQDFYHFVIKRFGFQTTALPVEDWHKQYAIFNRDKYKQETS